MKTILNALCKFAQELDKNGKYSEADKIDEMIKSLCERTGLSTTDDMVTMANDLDSLGLYEEANRIDEMIKIAKCPQCGNPDFALVSETSGEICEDCGYPMVKVKREPGVKKMLDVDKHKWQQKRLDEDYQEKLNAGDIFEDGMDE